MMPPISVLDEAQHDPANGTFIALRHHEMTSIRALIAYQAMNARSVEDIEKKLCTHFDIEKIEDLCGTDFDRAVRFLVDLGLR
jgi:hypothetical protein